jgi:hypothetical protein
MVFTVTVMGTVGNDSQGTPDIVEIVILRNKVVVIIPAGGS